MVATLVFCNDIDCSDWATYREVHRELEQEFGIIAEDSFWLFDPNGSEMALFGKALHEKGPRHDDLLEDISNHKLTVLHSAGNFSRTNDRIEPSRRLIADGLDYLKQRAGVPSIWTNHGDDCDIQNLGGASPRYQKGDDPSSDVYLIDLLLLYGFKFFCMDHHFTNSFVFSQNDPQGQPVVKREKTRSGFEVTCFFRYRGDLPKAPDAQTLGLQLTQGNLDNLVQRDGTSIVYQHWCVHRDCDGRPYTAGRPVFPSQSVSALKLLLRYRDQKLINIVSLHEALTAGAAMLVSPEAPDDWSVPLCYKEAERTRKSIGETSH
jgi:hypothetical protein